MKNQIRHCLARYLLAAIVSILSIPDVAQAPPIDDETLKTMPAPKFSLPAPIAKKPLPKRGHWTLEMKPGQYKIVNGILFERFPVSARPLVIAGLPEQPPQALMDRLRDLPRADTPQQARVLEDFAVWGADYYGRGLPAADKRTLLDLYKRTAREAARLKHKDLSADEQKEQEEKRAQLMTEFLLEERHIFRNKPDAQMHRYGRIVVTARSREPNAEDRDLVQRDILRFIRGEYLTGPARRTTFPAVAASAGKSYRIQGEKQGTFRLRAFEGIHFDERTGVAEMRPRICSTISSTWTSIARVEEPSVAAIVLRVFVTEHSVTGQTWEDIGLPSLYHTNIVVGRWWIEKYVEEVRTYTCTQLNQPPTRTTKRQSVYTQKFLDWPLAHGCAGEYERDDSFREVYSIAASGDDAADQLNKWLYGASADSDGARCRGRYGAYPKGTYGLNYVCHQICNAFAYIKWNIVPVYYPESFNLYWDFGNFGIADIKAPCQCPDTTANHPCILGNNCCWQFPLPAPGVGLSLGSGWHPIKGWIDTEFKYNDQPVPFLGWDESSVVVPQ